MGSFFWIISATYLTVISRYLYRPNPPFDGGEYYICFYLVYIGALFLFHKKKKLDDFHLPVWVFGLGSFIILFGVPLYEDDYYRYLWEGKVFLSGKSPYLFAPISEALKDIDFAVKERVAFAHIPSIYPPLALLWFGLGGIFNYPAGLIILMILNAVLVGLLLRRLETRAKSWHLYLLFPYLQKEFIQAVHIDLLAVFFFLMMILAGQSYQRSSFLFLSYWSKFLTIIILPFELLRSQLNLKGVLKGGALMLSLPLTIYLINDFRIPHGFNTFSRYWVWSPGFYSILDKLLIPVQARIVTFSFFAVYYFLILLGCFRLYLQKQFSEDFYLLSLYLVFSGLMFFTPVYNAWYAIWFLIPALLLKIDSGVYYGVMSIFCYTSYFSKALMPYGEFLCHIFFILSLVEIYKKGLLRNSIVVKSPIIG